MKFNELGISEPILKALESSNYELPTEIQAQTIPQALRGKDILGLAQTGTGKTASFAIPTLQRLDETRNNQRKIRSLVLTPTRELALQIQESFHKYGQNIKLRTIVVFGGVNQAKQVSMLKKGCDILVATPGRLLDLVEQKIIDLSYIEIFTLDEADRMLDMGFIHDINKVLKLLPVKKQTMLFSATMPDEIIKIVDGLLHNPVKVSVAPVSSTIDTVDQNIVYIDNSHKIDWIVDYLKDKHKEAVLVFTRTKRGADRVVRDLNKHHVKAKAIHGNKSQNARQLALKEFKSLTTPVLVATDIASRGIDINDLVYVINYDLPEIAETYVHRIGRTGRAGKSGISISLVNFGDIGLLHDIEKLIKKTIHEIKNDKYPLMDKTVKTKKQEKTAKKIDQQKVETSPKHSHKKTEDPAKSAKTKKSSYWAKRRAHHKANSN